MKLHTSYTSSLSALLLTVTLVLSGCSTASEQQVNSMEPHSDSQSEFTRPLKAKVIPIEYSNTSLAITEGQQIKVQPGMGQFRIPFMNFVNEQTGWAVKSGGDSKLTLIHTYDGGSQWTEQPIPGEGVHGLKFINQTTGWVLVDTNCKDNKKGSLVCSKEKLLHTSNAGATWTTQWETSASNDSNWKVNTKTIQFTDQQHGFALVNQQMISTNDGGQHWKKVNFDNTHFDPTYMSFPNGKTGYVTGVTKGSHPTLLVLKTTDYGLHWKKQFALSEPGEEWSSLGIDFADVNTGWLLSNQEGMLSGDLYRTTDGGKNWTKMSKQRTGRPTPTALDLMNANDGLISLDPGAGPIEGGIWSTTDGGKSFNNIAQNQGWGIHDLQSIAKNSIWAAGTGFSTPDYLIHSADGGKTWSQAYPPLHPMNHISISDKIHGFGIGIQNSNKQVLQTLDGGKTWTAIATLSGYSELNKISFVDPNHGFMLASYPNDSSRVAIHTLVTSDAGKTWTAEAKNFGEDIELYGSPNYFNFLDNDHGITAVYNATGLRILQTKNGGISWEQSFYDKELTSVEQLTMLSLNEGWYTTYGSERNQKTSDIYHMIDGKHWDKVGSLPGYGWNTKALSFPDSKHGWILGSTWINDSTSYGKEQYTLLSTKDGGKNWTNQKFSESLHLDFNPQLTFTDDLNGFISSSDSMLQTQDGGLTWTVLE